MNSRKMYKIAHDTHYKEYDLQKALVSYEKVIKDYPTSAEASVLRQK